MSGLEHVPAIRPRPKLDTPVGLFGGACSCGWTSDGLESEAGAWRSALAHAQALTPPELANQYDVILLAVARAISHDAGLRWGYDSHPVLGVLADDGDRMLAAAMAEHAGCVALSQVIPEGVAVWEVGASCAADTTRHGLELHYPPASERIVTVPGWW